MKISSLFRAVLSGLLAFGLLSLRVAAADFTVTTLADAGAGSLRAALALANANPDADTITFAAGLAGQTISLNTIGDGTFGPSALAVTTAVTMDGGTGGITLRQNIGNASATGGMRIFYVQSGGALTLRRLTVRDGYAKGGDGDLYGGGAAGLGGAIVNAGTLELVEATLTANQARGGSGNPGGNDSNGAGGLGGRGQISYRAYRYSQNGHTYSVEEATSTGGPPNGAIAYTKYVTDDDTGDVIESTETSTPAGFGGGGENTFENGSGGGFGGGGTYLGAGGFGGGSGSHFGDGGSGANGFGGGVSTAENIQPGGGAGLGGAVFNYGGTVLVTHATLAGNSAVAGSGGGGNNGRALGGAIFNLNGSVTATCATLANNSAPDGASSIYNLGDNGVATQNGPALPATSVSSLARVILRSSILSGSGGVVDYREEARNGGAVGSSGSGNVIAEAYLNSQATFGGGFAAIHPQLSALAGNGGPTATMALPISSGAIGLGNVADAAGLTTDQRGAGYPRLTQGRLDPGAYQQQANLTETPSLLVTLAGDVSNAQDNQTSLREALIYAQSLGGAQTISFAGGLAGQTITLSSGWSGAGDASALVVSTAVTIQGITDGTAMTLAVGAGVPRRHFYVSGTGVLTLQNVTLTGGNCPSGGGAIFSQGLLNVDGCTFTGNTSAQEGGALWNYGAGTQTQVKNSTFAGNTSVQNGGAISTACELLKLMNVTIADNSITGTVGGGIHQFNGTTRLVNTIVARNTANGSPNNVTSILNPLDAANSFNNLLGADVAGPSGSGLTHGVNGNKVGIAVASLGLGTLANNGGLTRTVALLPGSPAVNGGTAIGAPTIDQRGKLRPQFGVVDIGAYEQTPFDTGQTIVNVGGGFWYLGPDALGSDLRVYRELPDQLAVWVDYGYAVRLGQAGDGTVLVENSIGEVYARPGSTTGPGTAWPRLTSVVAGDGATWFFGPDSFGSDAYIYRWASGGAPTYSGGFGTQLSVAPNGAIFARNNAGNDYLRVGSDAGLGSSWQIVNRSLVSWRLLHRLPYDGTQDLANPAADGVANLLKYAFNLAPNIGDLARVNVAELPENGTAGLPFLYRDAQGRLVIEFLRRKAATLPGIACIVETGDDLTALQPLNLSGATVVSIDPTWERVTVTDPTVTPKRFGRVRVNVMP